MKGFVCRIVCTWYEIGEHSQMIPTCSPSMSGDNHGQPFVLTSPKPSYRTRGWNLPISATTEIKTTWYSFSNENLPLLSSCLHNFIFEIKMSLKIFNEIVFILVNFKLNSSRHFMIFIVLSSQQNFNGLKIKLVVWSLKRWTSVDFSAFNKSATEYKNHS
jgi:hypothetical protein